MLHKYSVKVVPNKYILRGRLFNKKINISYIFNLKKRMLLNKKIAYISNYNESIVFINV